MVVISKSLYQSLIKKQSSSATHKAQSQGDRVYNNISKGNKGLDLMEKKRQKKDDDDDDDEVDDKDRHKKTKKKKNYHSEEGDEEEDEEEDDYNSSLDHMFDNEGDDFRSSSRNYSYKQEPLETVHLPPPDDVSEKSDKYDDIRKLDKSFDSPPKASTSVNSASAFENQPSTSALGSLNRTSLAQISPSINWLTEKPKTTPPISQRLRLSRPPPKNAFSGPTLKKLDETIKRTINKK